MDFIITFCGFLSSYNKMSKPIFCVFSLTDFSTLPWDSPLFLVSVFYFVNTFNLLTVWYTAGIYLILLGLWLFLDDGDIFVGFLWVIDLGVGLIFFIFVLHYSTFAHQKSRINKTSREFSVVGVALLLLISLSTLLFAPAELSSTLTTSRIWIFLMTWYDYYEFFFNPLVTDLNLLHDLYFNSNAFSRFFKA